MEEMNNMNMEDVAVVEATDDVATQTNGSLVKKILTVAGGAALVYTITKGAKKVKGWNEERKAKKEAKRAAKAETFHSEIFDEDVEVSEEEVTE